MRVQEFGDVFARLCVPHVGVVIPTRGENQPAIRTEDTRLDRASARVLGMRPAMRQIQKWFACGRVANAGQPILRSGDYLATIGTKICAAHRTRVRHDIADRGAGRVVPDASGVVVANGDEGAAIGTEARFIDRAFVLNAEDRKFFRIAAAEFDRA